MKTKQPLRLTKETPVREEERAKKGCHTCMSITDEERGKEKQKINKCACVVQVQHFLLCVFSHLIHQVLGTSYPLRKLYDARNTFLLSLDIQ